MSTQFTSLAEFVKKEMTAKGYTTRTLAENAHTSFRSIGEVCSGVAEAMLKSGNLGIRKRLGLMQSIPRMLKALDADVDAWINHLGLTDENLHKVARTNKSRPSLPKQLVEVVPRNKVVTPELIAKLTKAQDALGDMFTVEMLLRILVHECK